MDEDGRNFLFGLTVSEIAFILFFLLVLLSSFDIEELEQQKKEIAQQLEQERNENKDLSKLVEEIQEAQGTDKKIDLDVLFIDLKKGIEAQRKLQDAEKENSELSAQVEAQQELERQLKDLKETLGTDDPKEVQEALKALVKLADEPTKDQLTPSEKIEALAQERTDMQGQLENMRYKMSASGMGPPPCWPDVNDPKQPEFVFDVYLHGDGTVTSKKIAPAHREKQYGALPNASKITSARLMLQEFAQASSEIRALGRENECVYFVKIDYESADACRYTIDVEEYYYKSVPISRRNKCSGL